MGPASAPRETGTGGDGLNTKAVIAIVVLFGSLPFAAASNEVHTEGGDVEGRAILFDLTRFDPDLAAVAGLAQAKVNWFGGAISFDKGREGWVYATTAGAGDPTKERLTPTGQWYNFTDNNGATWNVQEWFYLDMREVQYRLGDQTATEREGHKVYVWTVHTTEDAFRDAQLNLQYNFVVVVDVTKLGLHPVDETGQESGMPSRRRPPATFHTPPHCVTC